MKLSLLKIENFRGIRAGTIQFRTHTVLIGPNNSGKTTIIEALALVLGRDRLVRNLTEHDFFGSDPQPADRIRIVATITGFEPEDFTAHPDWFRDGRGVPVWFDPQTGDVVPEKTRDDQALACQIAVVARFDRESLEVETARYFYDDPDTDVFAEDSFVAVPGKLIRELGFFLIPANRSWDRMLSFGSELFRRVIRSAGGLPAETIVTERDRLRNPAPRLEDDARLRPVVDEVNVEIANLLGSDNPLRLRLTATDSESVLESVVPHFVNQGGGIVPSKRQGSGLISLQSLFLLLHFGQRRIEDGESFCMALEEPELHLPPSIQRRVLSRLQSLSTQTIISTHRGERRINEDQAAIVRHIFEAYAAGKSPKAIAHALNRQKVPGPSGEGWAPSTINGNWRRGTGILNNELYIGRLVWNRQSFIKNPETGRRVARPNPEAEWITKDVPELRIIDQALWEKVKERQKGLRRAREFHEKRRPRMLLSFLLRCGTCGGGFSKVSEKHYGCSTARNKGTCDNRLTVRQAELEGLVLSALQERLMDPALLEEFCEEYTAHLNRLRGEKNASRSAARAELGKIERDRERLIQAIKDGVPAAEVKDDLARIAARREELLALLEGTTEEPVLLHPNMAAHYRKQVADLAQALTAEENRAEAADLLRSLLDRIELTPNDRGRLEIDLYGDLAGILTLAANKNRPLEASDPSVQQVKVVAGAGFEPATFRL